MSAEMLVAALESAMGVTTIGAVVLADVKAHKRRRREEERARARAEKLAVAKRVFTVPKFPERVPEGPDIWDDVMGLPIQLWHGCKDVEALQALLTRRAAGEFRPTVRLATVSTPAPVPRTPDRPASSWSALARSPTVMVAGGPTISRRKNRCPFCKTEGMVTVWDDGVQYCKNCMVKFITSAMVERPVEQPFEDAAEERVLSVWRNRYAVWKNSNRTQAADLLRLFEQNDFTPEMRLNYFMHIWYAYMKWDRRQRELDGRGHWW